MPDNTAPPNPAGTAARRKRCNHFGDMWAVPILCWQEPGHDGLHRSRRGDYGWGDPPERMLLRCRRCWWRRRWFVRYRDTHPYSGGAVWLWAYKDERGHAIPAPGEASLREHLGFTIPAETERRSA